MSDPSSLKMLLDLARDRADAAGRKLGELNTKRADDERKLQLLLSYREDYRARFQQAASGGIDTGAWRNFHAFMHKLDTAIAEQRKCVESSEHVVEQGRNAWLSEQRKVKSFDTLTLRRGHEVRVKEARREQRDQDEFAQTARRHRAAKHDPV
jgi:flagellar FliJ protein